MEFEKGPAANGNAQPLACPLWEVCQQEASRDCADDPCTCPLLDVSPMALVVLDMAGHCVVANRTLERISGYSREELAGIDAIERLLPEWVRHDAREGLAALYRDLGSPDPIDLPLVCRDEDVRLLRWRAQLLCRGADCCVGVALFGEDISDRKQAEVESGWLGAAIAHTSEAVIVTDLDANILYCNPAFEQITGYTAEEVIGRSTRILQSGKHDQVFYEALWLTLEAGKTWEGRFINRRKDGSLYHEWCSISPVFDVTGAATSYVAVKRDITQEVVLQQQQAKTQKMEALGRLAGGVAHDFNNLLQVILSCGEMLREPDDDPALAAQQVDTILEAASRARALTRQLLAFSRREQREPAWIQLNEAVEGLMKMLGRLLGDDIQLRVDARPGIPPIHADPGQVEQVIINLCVNARDAMPRGGRLIIQTGTCRLDARSCRPFPWARPGPHAYVSVLDTGCGIQPEHLDRLFEPLFTTKPEGQGTGLGLATVIEIVRQHEGVIKVDSQAGAGSVFHVYFPIRLVHTGKPDSSRSVTPPRSARAEPLSVLMVEDDELVRACTMRFLEAADHRVTACRGAGEAIEKMRSGRNDFDIAVLDIVMPGMHGDELARTLRAFRPDLPVLFASAYPQAEFDASKWPGAPTRFIEKPFQRVALLELIAKMVGEATGRKPARR